MAHPVNVIVEHDYTAADDVELTIRRGDVITNVEKKEGGWWRGELRGRIGLFPDNFVKLQDDVVLRNNSPRYCRALFSYKACNPDELNLAVGDTIQILGEVEEGWWKGQRGKLMGVFPSNFVIPLEETPPLPPKPVREQCKVIFPYTAANADELTLVEGDILTIISKDVADVGWWRGEHQGKSGLFPDNFVTILPVQSEGSDKKSLRSIKHLPSTVKSHTSSLNKKDSHSSGQENVAAVRKSLEPIDNHIYDPISSKFKKSMDSNESNLDSEKHKLRKSHDGESASETKSRRTLDVDNAGAKPPIPAKKAGSPVSAIFIGLRQKVYAVEQRLSGGQQSSDTADGAASSKSSGEPILTSISPSPSPVPPIINTTSSVDQAMSESFDQVERGSMLNDLRSGRVKGPPRRPPSQTTRDDAPLTNGNSNHNSSTESASETEIKPKTREWEKHKAPWMEELKQNQAKKTSPIGDIGRSKTVSSTDSSTNEVSQSRLSSSSDKIIESGESETLNDVLVNDSLEMSQSMSSLSSKAIKIDTSTEVQNQAENPQDMSKSLLSMSTRGSHVEMNNKVSSNELRTSISSSASVILRSTTHSANPSPYSQTSSINSSQVYKNLPPISPEIKVSTSIPIPNPTIDDGSLPNTANGITYPDMTPEQLLIQQLNERVANLERVVETQEKILATLSAKLNRESELRVSLQAEIQKLERCVTRV